MSEKTSSAGAPVGAGTPAEVPAPAAGSSGSSSADAAAASTVATVPESPPPAAEAAWRHPPARCHRGGPAMTVSRFPAA